MFICKKNEDYFLVFLNFTIIGAILDHCDKDVNHLILAVVMYNGYMFFSCQQALCIIADVWTETDCANDRLRK